MERYFAYGSNLNLRDLELWCQRLGRPPALMVKAGVPAYLPDHEVVFDYLSSSRKGGVLDLLPSVGRIVPGALFEATEEDLRTLDLKEGVPLIYHRVEKKVLLADGREVMARAYEVAPGYRLPAPVAPAGRAGRRAPWRETRAFRTWAYLLSGRFRAAKLAGGRVGTTIPSRQISTMSYCSCV